MGWNFISWVGQIHFINPVFTCPVARLNIHAALRSLSQSSPFNHLNPVTSHQHVSVLLCLTLCCTFMATVSLTSTDLSCPLSSKKTSLCPALFRSPSARALMWRILPRSSSTCGKTQHRQGQRQRNEIMSENLNEYMADWFTSPATAIKTDCQAW